MTTADVARTSQSDCVCTGSFKRETGTQNCIQCDTGERFAVDMSDASQGVCSDCAAGLYQDATAHLLPGCLSCPIGKYRTEAGGMSSRACVCCHCGLVCVSIALLAMRR